MRIWLSILITAWLLVGADAGPGHAKEPTAAGLWEQVDDVSGRVQGWFLISERDGVYESAIVKMFLKPGDNPNPICTKCKGDQKSAPVLGLTIIKGMKRNGLKYEDGTILDPRDGSVYGALMEVSPDGQRLTVRGYLGISLLGRNQIWNRLPDSAFAQVAPDVFAAHPPARQPLTLQPPRTPSKQRDPAVLRDPRKSQ